MSRSYREGSSLKFQWALVRDKTLLNRSLCRLTWGCLWLTPQAITHRYSSSPEASLTSQLRDAAIPAIIYLCPQPSAHWSGKAAVNGDDPSVPTKTPLKLYILLTQLHSCLGLSRSEGTLIFERDASCCLRSVEAWLSYCHGIDKLYVYLLFSLIYFTCGIQGF